MSTAAPDVMQRLEKAIERLSDTGAPLDRLVAAHEEALRLLDEAESELARLRERAAEVAESLKT